MNVVQIVIGLVFMLIAIVSLLVLYDRAIAPTYGFPTLI